MFSLIPMRPFKVPIDAGCITPDIFSGKSNSEIAALQAWEGNRRVKLGELFKISYENNESKEELTIKISGDLKKVRRIGAAMSAGKIVIEGDVGNHLGEEIMAEP